MDESIGYAVDAAVTMLEKGPDEAMNRFNESGQAGKVNECDNSTVTGTGGI